MQVCPVCGSRGFAGAVSEKDVRKEILERERFVYSRTPASSEPVELKDLIDFMHGGPASLRACLRCATLVRDEGGAAVNEYGKDVNDPDLMRHLLPRYTEAFRKREAAYRPLLRPRAEVLEIGSHLGAFLQAAGEWNWDAAGLDVGEDTAGFAKRRGLTVFRENIEDYRRPNASLDAVFVWNCFEQLEEPAVLLRCAWRLLKRHGLLILRVPNARFYLTSRNEQAARRELAYNNLLGFPYLYGYTGEGLQRLAGTSGFAPVREFNSELITMPFAELSWEIADEEASASRRAARRSAKESLATVQSSGPWIEAVYRKSEEPLLRQATAAVDFRFQPRAL